MRKVTLGKSGLQVSAVGFGGIPIQRISRQEAVSVIRRSLELGVNFIDTAAGYSDSQQKIGEAIEGQRDRLVLASKSGERSAGKILADVERSCEEMKTDYIDLYQLHGVSSRECWEQVSATGGALEGLIVAREKGLIRHIGFSSHSLDLSLTLVNEPIFETIQFPFNLVTVEPEKELIPLCRRLQVGFIVMKPLCGGQYDNAGLAFKFLNAYPDLVAIPGIEQAREIEEIVSLVQSRAVLAGEQLVEAKAIAEKLGKQFCRRCGYCEPCHHEVPVLTSMVLEGLLKRLPLKNAMGVARHIAVKNKDCDECGACEKKCPYDLPIRVNIRKAEKSAKAFLRKHGESV